MVELSNAIATYGIRLCTQPAGCVQMGPRSLRESDERNTIRFPGWRINNDRVNRRRMAYTRR